ncbi:hypothetical protein [Natronocalculus amylovorans]|uniref:Uncharacterized protein n=1 Tax=Natronocalculus amylovorans TaxID=2917812 RepID=A0AAE3FYV9_9EURY|nr:hypothetical protein [Natronocalculus amylovorans]MCL9817740.1 hypothetical protein [Natronocalculus amylovorans]
MSSIDAANRYRHSPSSVASIQTISSSAGSSTVTAIYEHTREISREINHRVLKLQSPNAQIEIVWFENGDFSLHYHEDHEQGQFDHRWDRHPSDHNARDHIHLGLNALTPGGDLFHPSDWRDVLSVALSEVEARQRAFWEE